MELWNLLLGRGKSPVAAVRKFERVGDLSVADNGARVPAGFDHVANIYYAAFHASEAAVRADRKLKLFLMLVIAALIAFIVLRPPSHKVETRILEVESATGRVAISSRTPAAINEATDRSMVKVREFYLREFVVNLISLDSRTIKERAPFAASMLQGARAKNVFDEYIYTLEKIPEKIAQTPGLTREYEHKSVSTSADGKTAFVRFKRVEKVNGQIQTTTPMIVTLEFVFIPAEAGQEKDLNPLGLNITYFTVALDQ